MAFHHHESPMNPAFQMAMLGAGLVAVGILWGGWWLTAAWLGINFVILAFAHLVGGHRVFGKQMDGTLPVWSWLLFLPLLAYTYGIWNLLRTFLSEAPCNQVTDTLTIGRRLLVPEAGRRFDNYVDLTAEFAEPDSVRTSPAYRCFPILDGAAPSPEALAQAVRSLRPGSTFVHCAQGHGRTGLFALAVLLSEGTVRNVEDGLRMLKHSRPAIRLNKNQLKCVRIYAEKLV